MAQQFPQRTKTILDDPSLRLSADVMETGTGRPTFKVIPCGRNMIRIDIYTNLPNDKDNGLIRADVPYSDFGRITDKIMEMADPSYPAEAIVFAFEDFTFFNKKRSDKKQLIYRIVLGKEEDGRIYISVLLADPDRAKIKFYFGDAFRLTVRKASNGTITDAQIASMSAKSWVNNFWRYAGPILSEAWQDRSPNANGGNGNGNGGGNRGNGGGYNNNRGGNGGYNNNSSGNELDSGLPF